jgi:hypothetical protein
MGFHVSKPLLLAVNGAAALLLLGMTDLDSSIRLLVAAVLAINVLLLIGKTALLKRSAQLGASASLVGYVGTVGSWLVMAIGCGIEYYNARCDAVVTPLLTTFVIVSLAGLPVGRICGAFLNGDR